MEDVSLGGVIRMLVCRWWRGRCEPRRYDTDVGV